jgi:hypothetical protein
LLTTCYEVVELNRLVLVINCSNNLLSSCNSTVCQQVVSDNLVQLDKITAILLQLVDRLVTSLLRTHLVRAFFKNSSVGGAIHKKGPYGILYRA